MTVATAVGGNLGQVRQPPEPLKAIRPAGKHRSGPGRKPCQLEPSNIVCEPSPLAIHKQLSQIFRSELFVRAQRMRRFLTYVVEEALAGRREQISEYSIGIAVFDRSDAFEPGLDPIVRNEARRLRQKLGEYYRGPASGGGHHVLIEIPKGGYVPAFHLAPAGGGPQTLRISVAVSGGPGPARIWEQEYRIDEQSTFRVELEVTGSLTKKVEAPVSNA